MSHRPCIVLMADRIEDIVHGYRVVSTFLDQCHPSGRGQGWRCSRIVSGLDHECLFSIGDRESQVSRQRCAIEAVFIWPVKSERGAGFRDEILRNFLPGSISTASKFSIGSPMGDAPTIDHTRPSPHRTPRRTAIARIVYKVLSPYRAVLEQYPELNPTPVMIRFMIQRSLIAGYLIQDKFPDRASIGLILHRSRDDIPGAVAGEAHLEIAKARSGIG